MMSAFAVDSAGKMCPNQGQYSWKPLDFTQTEGAS